MKKAFIFIHCLLSKSVKPLLNIRSGDLLIGVDGGAENILKLDLKPDVVLGDFDSLSNKLIRELDRKQIPLIKYPKEKDFTDSQIALDFAIKQKINRVIFVGLTGNRLDHVLTNLFFISHPKYKNLEISFIDYQQEIYIVTNKLTLTGRKKDIVSLIPLLNNVTNISTSGLKFGLNNETLYLGDSRGVSNMMIGSTAKISIKSGLLLIIHHL